MSQDLSQSSDLKLCSEEAVFKQMPANLNELKQQCKEECAAATWETDKVLQKMITSGYFC